MDSRTAFLHDMWLRGVSQKPRTRRDSCPSAHPVPLPQFVTLLQPHESVSAERLSRETCWAYRKHRLEGIGQRDGTLIADDVIEKDQLSQGLVLLVICHVIITCRTQIAQLEHGHDHCSKEASSNLSSEVHPTAASHSNLLVLRALTIFEDAGSPA